MPRTGTQQAAHVILGQPPRTTRFVKTGDRTTVAALSDKDVNLFSDLALDQMGPGLADNIRQGEAEGEEFCTAPLWGLGQRSSSSTTGARPTLSRQFKLTRAQAMSNLVRQRPTL
jgi:CxxC motif-containing protein (DUF1111 family)